MLTFTLCITSYYYILFKFTLEMNKAMYSSNLNVYV